ncbi:T9SS type B sorting domain-containing protein [Neolewinella litorea]|uniref:T9SS type B sorting domain-containing protein n=1 Tax=Neolewinella litorea TaxID=2562452 RepID=A0A4S4NNQ5_9BACT|nr:T9SS type B sorting domain-containing protein [Neolewinella litorea]
MSNFTKLVLLITLNAFSIGLLAQTSCGQEEPFLLPPTSTFCADSVGMVTVNFKIYNNGDPGTYRVKFPDGSDTLYTGVVNTVDVSKRFLFDCGAPPGKPTPPSDGALYFEYAGALTVVREDCVDERGDNQKGTYDFRVVPNPIVNIKHSNLKCIEEPFKVNFEGKMCSDKLVESYQWYIDGELIEGATQKKFSGYEFGEPGTYVVKLEVTPYKGCDKYYYEKTIVIQPMPQVELSYMVDTTQLCNETIQVFPNSTYKYATSFKWSSDSEDVSFSDPSAPNPVITIQNNQAGTKTITVLASNQNCSAKPQTIEITTSRGQRIAVLEEIITCTGYVLDLCSYLEFTPTPDNIRWSANVPNVSFSDSTALCPLVTFQDVGEVVLTASGTDACGESFAIPVDVRVRDGARLEIDISSIDTLCTTEAPIALLDYIQPSFKVSRITGPGVVDNIFDPSVVEGKTEVTVVDSCGAVYPLEFLVIPQEKYSGIQPEVCVGGTVDLAALQAGNYSGTGVTNNVFESAGLAIGTYEITYTSLSYCGGEDTLYIKVQEYPTAAFEIVTDSCGGGAAGAMYAGLESILIENRSSAQTRSFTVLETGQTAQNREKAKFTFLEPGVYTIEQVVAFPGGVCTDTITRSIEVLFPPTVNFSYVMDSTVCDSLTIDFSAGNQPPGVSYRWAFSSTDRSEEAAPRVHLLRPLAPEVLGVDVSVMNSCYTTADTFGVVLPLRFRVSFDVLNDNNTVCSDDTIFLANTSVNADNFRVSYPDGRQATFLPSELVLRNEEKKVLKYPITLQGSNISCPDEEVTDTIYVLPITTDAAFSLDYDNICSSTEVTLTNASTPGALTFVHWGDNSSPQLIDELESITHTYRVKEDTEYQISLSAQLCGIDTFRNEITVRPSPDPSFEITAVDANCEGKDMVFSSTAETAPFGLNWDFGDGQNSQERNPVYAYEQAGTYTVYAEAVSENGCTAVDSFDLSIGTYDGAPMSFSLPSTTCMDSPFELELSAPLTGWTIDYGNGMIAETPIERPYFDEGTYVMKLTATSANGCQIDSTTTVKVFPSFDATIRTANRDTLVELGDELDLRVQVYPPRNITKVQWYGDSIQNASSPYTTALPLDDGFYTINLTDEHGCTASDSLRVSVRKNYEDRIYAPNAFSPNGDGYNETFGLEVKSNTVRSIRALRVMSRYGALVYECTDCNTGTVGTGWDGTLGGKPLQSSVYLWAAEVEFVDGSSQIFTGDIALLR